MKFVLTDYQELAAMEVTAALRRATRDFERDGEYWALSLSAPTAAGKTVIATAVIERLLGGDDAAPADPLATILWVTDDPSLNEQTRRKMMVASSSLQPSQLVTIDQAFDQETLDPGRVYFLNIQKLGRTTSFVRGGTDDRSFSVWTTLAATIRERGGHFYMIIDEAHRGARPDTSRPSIVSRLVSDPEGIVPPSPVVWGISATPERFQAAMSAASTPSRTRRDVTVDVDSVRESGLLKDKILIKHPTAAQPSDATLTRLAVSDLRTMTARWALYSEQEHEPTVVPALAIQVPPSASDRQLTELVETLVDEWPELTPDSIGHAFESHTALSVSGMAIRYVAPQDIQDDQELRVILFKEALTTGWDCPRAEIMLSFRRAQDYTYIAQLIGRMVRTPLAKRIATDDLLNAVGLYLPFYDDENVTAVVQRLREDPDAPPVTFERNSVECGANDGIPDAVRDLLCQLPSYVVPGRAHRSQVARLHTLATLLAGDGFDEQACDLADAQLVATLERERERLAADGSLAALVTGLGSIAYRTRTLSLRDDSEAVAEATTPISAKNIDDVFRDAGRGFRDGLAKTYWGALVDGGTDPDEAKLLTAALAGEVAVVAAVETAAEGLVQTWLREHSRSITELLEARKAPYYAIRAQARESEQVSISLPMSVTAPGDEDKWGKHIYSTETGQFPAHFTSWERDTLEAELATGDTLVGWYRNPTGGERALRVPYKDGEFDKPLYPDFIFFHELNGELRPSIVDPHNYAYADSGPKWRGLATYAERHGDAFARIDAVIRDEAGALLRLDLKDPTARVALGGVSTKDDMLQVFRELGGNYA